MEVAVIMEFMSVRDASKLWEISERWVQKLCEEGRIAGVERFGRSWMIPKAAERPEDQRKTHKKKE